MLSFFFLDKTNMVDSWPEVRIGIVPFATGMWVSPPAVWFLTGAHFQLLPLTILREPFSSSILVFCE